MAKNLTTWLMIGLIIPSLAFAGDPPITTTVTHKKPSVSPAAQQAMEAQRQAAMMNMIAAGMLTAACLAPCPKCMTPLCVMGAMAAMQGGHDMGAAAQSNETYDTATNRKPSTNVTTQQPSDDPNDPTKKAVTNPGASKLGAGVPSSVLEANKLLESQGYKVDENGVTNPDGSFTPASAFASPGAMASAGMDPAVIAEAQKIISGVDTSAVAGMPSMAVDGGGGMGPASATGNEASDANYGSKYGIGADQRKAMLAGKTVLFDGEPIGVRGDNIFDMMRAAYQKKRDARSFIETETAASLRAPASTLKTPKK